jgi:hypothetical protein
MEMYIVLIARMKNPIAIIVKKEQVNVLYLKKKRRTNETKIF